jgi:hypothetical protein
MECATVSKHPTHYYFKTQYGAGKYIFPKELTEAKVIEKIKQNQRDVIEISQGKGILSKIIWQKKPAH